MDTQVLFMTHSITNTIVITWIINALYSTLHYIILFSLNSGGFCFACFICVFHRSDDIFL